MVSPSVILSTATIPPSLISYIRAHFPECAKVLSPTLHRLPTQLQTRFVPWSGSGNKLADVVHELRKTFAAEGTERRQALQTAKEDEPFEKSKILIFANTVNKVKALRKMLEEKDIPVLGITGEAEERIRGSNGLLDEFLLQPGQAPGVIKKRKGGNHDKAPRVLVTTSLLSRGLDFAPSVKHVFLLDEPRDILDFMHRAGRTGRAGRVGNVVVFGSGSGGGRAGTLGRRQFSPERRMKQWQAGSKLGKDLKDVLRRD
jgi:ATP-dependent RNA helicase MRH4